MTTDAPYAPRPALFEKTPFPFWDDDYISANMLAAHLNPTLDAASRNKAFIDLSAKRISELASHKKSKRLLDLGCGPGLYVDRFYAAGFDVCGIDISRRSVAYAKTHFPHADYRCGDYLTVDFPENIDIAAMIYCDFGVLSRPERTRILEKTYRALVSGGVFVFDVFTPAQYAEKKEEQTKTTVNDADFWSSLPHRLTDERLYYPDDTTWLRRVTVETANETKCYHIWEHLFTRDELTRDLRTAGFSDIVFYNDATLTPLTVGTPTLCAVAVKP